MPQNDWLLTWNTVLAISTALMSAAIVFTACYAAIQLRHIKRERYASVLMQLHEIWESNDSIESRTMVNQHCTGVSLEEAAKRMTDSLKHLDNLNTKQYFLMIKPAQFFENLGYLTCEGHLERKHSIEVFGDAAARYWQLFKDYAVYQRANDPTARRMWIYFEYLALGCPKNKKCLEIKPSTPATKTNN